MLIKKTIELSRSAENVNQSRLQMAPIQIPISEIKRIISTISNEYQNPDFFEALSYLIFFHILTAFIISVFTKPCTVLKQIIVSFQRFGHFVLSMLIIVGNNLAWF